nr:MAG TPA: Alginate and motility regulator [Caudoviricetes sp.]
MSDKKKAGRPFSENPKSVKLTVRVDCETVDILDAYCRKNNISRADGVREGIKALKDK